MDEKQLERAMQLISISGNAKSLAIQAMDAAEKKEFQLADEKLLEAKKILHEAHNVQTEWMSAEMGGEVVEKTILLIHAQDHFISADTILLISQKLINLQKELVKIKA
ncbi:MAG: PTS lactose/cellobiose transporter subunit IIA [Enterococcus sp.]|nr:PTS lactose/cellobiose transporter subunit IIA [Enterococcus sp.]